MTKCKETLTNEFFNELIGFPVKVFLNNGKAISGTLKGHDADSLVVSGKPGSSSKSLILKNNVSTVYRDEEQDTHGNTA